ncbi:sensor domain-containing diguanylate cyclase [Psychromonas aquimarina]|uniref:sensor domain-containing diguanylate cyclase n=1 Tax=Psychromonas aquimarina TaxID=444919 RepID=UPI0003FA4FCF|nr:diguanylate cyclase [Psychromonas aquimarina]
MIKLQPTAFIKLCFLALIIAGLMYGIYYLNPPQSTSVQVEKGKIDISQILNGHNSIDLNGEWLFFYNEFLSSEQIKSRLNSNLHKQSYIDVPSNWKLNQFDQHADPTEGYGTYHLQIKTGKGKTPLAVKLPTIGIAYRIYQDQKLLSTVGKAGSSKQQTQGDFQPQILLLETSSELFTLTLHVASYEYGWGGIWYPLQIGSAQTIIQEQKLSSMNSLFISGFFFAVAIYNLILFFLRTLDKLPLIFSLLCFILGLRELVVQDAVILNYFSSLNIIQLIIIEYTSFFLAVPLACHFFYLTFPQFFDKRILISSYVISLLLTIGLLIRGLEGSYLTLVLMQLITPLFITYILCIMTKAYFFQQKGTSILLAGTFALAFCAVNDILYAQEFINSGYLVSYGLLLFVISQSYMTGLNFTQAFQHSESLAAKLKKRNLILEDLRLSLESKVKERTNELAEANLHLQKLAHTDALTSVLNRHGIQSIIENTQQRFKRSGEVYSIAVIDLDHFKEVNDQFGHDAGDEVLKRCAQLIKVNIRKQDTFARWGGEEFVILLPNTNLPGAMTLAEKIRKVTAQSVMQFNGLKIQITATIGVSEIQVNEGFEQAFKRADLALFTAKDQGRNQVTAGLTEDQ